MGKVTRRFILGSGVTLVVVGAGSYLGCALLPSDEAAGFERLDVMLADIIDPARIGRAARATIGWDVLRSEAHANLCIVEAMRIDCAVTRRAHLQAGSRVDFANNKIVLCDRFVTSYTETIVAGLRYMS